MQGPRRVDAHRRLLDRAMLGANAIVGGGIALAVGGGARRADVSATAGSPWRSSATAPANQGIFHESLNLAAIWRLPVVFVCENNGWAESTPAAYAMAVADVVDRAAGYGMPGRRSSTAADVDGRVRGRRRGGRPGPRGATGRRCWRPRSARYCGHFVGDPEALPQPTTTGAAARERRPDRAGCAADARDRRRRRGRARGARSRRRPTAELDAAVRRRPTPAAAVDPTALGARCLRRLTRRPTGTSASLRRARRRARCAHAMAADPSGDRPRRGHRRRRRAGRAARGRDGRHVRRHQGPARGVRAAPRPRHADLGGRLSSAPAVGAAVAGLRPIVDLMWVDFAPYCDGPDRQPGRQAALHVRRPGAHAARHPHGRRRRAPRRGAALRHAVRAVHPRARAQGRGAADAGRGQGPAARPRSTTTTR